jgi:endonuclease-3
MSLSTRSATGQRLRKILAALTRSRPNPRVELHFHNPWQLLVATILSAQCTDQRVNQVTPVLFRRYVTPADFAKALPAELEALIKPTGFYKSKTKHLIACGKVLTEEYAQAVPPIMEKLTALPGVGRKTANVLLGNAFGKPAIIVDTHVKRVSGRLGLTRATDPDKIEADLQRLLPPARWTTGSQHLLLHGRYTCLARKPRCGDCPIYKDCHWEGKRQR